MTDSKIPFDLPKRKYCDGEKNAVSMRLPAKLLKEINAIADESGWAMTDVVATALDQFVQWNKTTRRK